MMNINTIPAQEFDLNRLKEFFSFCSSRVKICHDNINMNGLSIIMAAGKRLRESVRFNKKGIELVSY